MTTVLAVRRNGRTAVGGDGQVTIGSTIVKESACKIRRLSEDSVIVGFAGVSADALALIERFEGKIKRFQGNLMKACVELAKEWRLDKSLRRLDSMLLVADKQMTLLVSGNGDVIQPDDDVCAIGSGSGFAIASARALCKFTDMPAKDVVRESLLITSKICIYTNSNIVIEEL